MKLKAAKRKGVGQLQTRMKDEKYKPGLAHAQKEGSTQEVESENTEET